MREHNPRKQPAEADLDLGRHEQPRPGCNAPGRRRDPADDRRDGGAGSEQQAERVGVHLDQLRGLLGRGQGRREGPNAVGDTATFLAVDLDPGVPARDLHGFLASVDAKNLPTMVDAKFGLLAKYNVSALSSVIVIDPAGKVTYRAINPSAGAITAAIAQST